MKIIDIRKKLPSKGSNGKMDLKNIKYCVIHHDAEFMPLRYNSLARYIKHANLHISKGWKHISYHYIIDNIGDIYQCLDENEVGYHAGNLPVNKSSIAVKFDGNFEIQKPTAKQIQAYKELMIWLTTKRPDLPKLIRSSVKGHYQIKPTACPGANIKPLINKF